MLNEHIKKHCECIRYTAIDEIVHIKFIYRRYFRYCRIKIYHFVGGWLEKFAVAVGWSFELRESVCQMVYIYVWACAMSYLYTRCIYGADIASPLSVSLANKSNGCCCCCCRDCSIRDNGMEGKVISMHKQWNQFGVVVSCNRNENLNPLVFCVVARFCFVNGNEKRLCLRVCVCAMAQRKNSSSTPPQKIINQKSNWTERRWKTLKKLLVIN